ncbi:MAG: tRNA (uridine(54)-C5)-methyltransferase TrmA [Succinivibrio sp.]|nr:tRNA (uridine(54)-C5)-methyltransferase TrmA [Succinivibrio sp.]
MLKTLLTSTDPDNYDNYLNEKINYVTTLLRDSGIDFPAPEIFKSLKEHYRMRAEFSVFFNENASELYYVMFEPHSKPKKKIIIDNFPIASVSINQAMQELKALVPDYPEIKNRLFEIDFLSNKKGELIITLIYHRKLDELSWQKEAEVLRDLLSKRGLYVNFVARSKKQKILVSTDSLIEEIATDRQKFMLKQTEGNFSQPNISACENMVNFARKCCKDQSDKDLLELYCGSGTFTVCLAGLFKKVLATEVSRTPTENALFNIRNNEITNTQIVRLSAVEVAQALENIRKFRRLELAEININDYNFSTLFIDPPRSGLQYKEALDFTAKFDRIIYISCGKESFASDLKYLQKTHTVSKLAFFDQFPYTEHLESGALLLKK